MTLFRPFSWIIPLVMIGLVIAGGMKLKQNYTDVVNRSQVEDSEFRQSPGCVSNAEYVNPALPPCQELSVKILSKTRQHHSGGPNNPYHEWYDNFLDVRDGSGRSHHLVDVSDEPWNSVKVGDQITARFWRGHIISLIYGGIDSGVLDVKEHPVLLTERITKNWSGVFFVGMMVFFVWSRFRRFRSRRSF